MHGQLVAYVLQWSDGAPDPNAVRIAILTLVGGVIATAGTVLVAFRSPREPRSEQQVSRGDERYHAALKSQLADAKAAAESKGKKLAAAEGRIAVYERFLWRHHIEPAKIVRGDEGADDVRF